MSPAARPQYFLAGSISAGWHDRETARSGKQFGWMIARLCTCDGTGSDTHQARLACTHIRTYLYEQPQTRPQAHVFAYTRQIISQSLNTPRCCQACRTMTTELLVRGFRGLRVTAATRRASDPVLVFLFLHLAVSVDPLPPVDQVKGAHALTKPLPLAASCRCQISCIRSICVRQTHVGTTSLSSRVLGGFIR